MLQRKLMEKIAGVLTVLMVWALLSGVCAAETSFFTEWGVGVETVLAREPVAPFNDDTMRGSRFLSFNTTFEGLRASVTYGFTKDKLYFVMYSLDTEPEPLSGDDAEILKQKLDGLVLAQMARPRYMLCPMTDFVKHSGYSSWFVDKDTLAQSLGTYLPNEKVFQYFVNFTSVKHKDAVQSLRLFEDYWQGILTDVPFSEKRDLSTE